MISFVVPVYNEEESVALFIREMSAEMSRLGEAFEFVFVDDGSEDMTLAALDAALAGHTAQVVSFSRNFGKEAALLAGLHRARGEAVIPIDVDLQDPPELIGAMIAKWREGAEVVVAVREGRPDDSFLKRSTAGLFYRLFNRLSRMRIVENAGDFRLLDRKVVDVLRQLPERTLFMKGLLSWPGFRVERVSFVRKTRAAGRSKFNYWKLWNFAIDGITSYSTAPLRIWFYIGSAVFLASAVYALLIVAGVLIRGVDVPGYASIMVAVLGLGSLQIMALGVIGEYVGRISEEVKGRPSYVVRATREYAPDGTDPEDAAS